MSYSILKSNTFSCQDSSDNGLALSLHRDELLAWVDGHDFEPPGKRATKKGTSRPHPLCPITHSLLQTFSN
jgi:hypothetical protein